MKRSRRALRRRYGRSQVRVPLAPGQKVRLAVLKTPIGTCAFEVIDQAGNTRGLVEYSVDGYRFASSGGVHGAWVKTRAQAMAGFKRMMRGKS